MLGPINHHIINHWAIHLVEGWSLQKATKWASLALLRRLVNQWNTNANLFVSQFEINSAFVFSSDIFYLLSITTTLFNLISWLFYSWYLRTMAAAASAPVDGSEDVVSCVYCLEVEPYLIDPRMLPCGHIFCSSCLSKDAKTNQIIKCANCRCALQYT